MFWAGLPIGLFVGFIVAMLCLALLLKEPADGWPEDFERDRDGTSGGTSTTP